MKSSIEPLGIYQVEKTSDTGTETHDSSDFGTKNTNFLTCKGGPVAKNQDPVLRS